MSVPTDMTLPSPLPLSDDDLDTHVQHESSPGVLSSSLPYPDTSSLNAPPGQKKKSHARKQPAGHIPRPRNAFILFRCDFVRQKKVPDHVEANHRNISRIVGSVWKSMSASQKAPWIAMAEIEKKNHAKAHPGYKYHPGCEGRGRESQIRKVLYSTTEPISGKGISPSVSPNWTPSPSFTPPTASLRRSSSCPPPGAFPVLRRPSFGLTQSDMLGLSAPLMTRDDLARRPSRAIMYQSIMPLYSFDSNPANTTPPSTGNTLSSAQWWATDPGSGSPLTTGPYTIAPPGDAPGWDAAPKKPNTWYTWSEGNVGPHAMNPMALCSPNDLNTDFTNLTSQWNYDRVPTFTNPFGAVPSATSTNDISLTWNPDTSFMSRQELMSEAQAHDFTSNAFDSANYLQNDIPRSGAYTVEDLDNLFKTRMSLVENDPGFPEAEQVSKGQPQFYWGAREETNQEGLLPVHYLRDENGLYYHAVNEVHKLNGEGSREPVNTPSNNHSTVYSNNDMSLSRTAVQALKEKVEKEWQRSRVRPSASSSLSSTSSPTGVGPSTTPLPTFRRPMLTAEDLQRLEESAGLRGNERATPENYERLRASITEHYLKKYSELKREARGKVIPKSEEKTEDEVQISLHPHQGDAKRETYYQ